MPTTRYNSLRITGYSDKQLADAFSLMAAAHYMGYSEVGRQQAAIDSIAVVTEGELHAKVHKSNGRETAIIVKPFVIALL